MSKAEGCCIRDFIIRRSCLPGTGAGTAAFDIQPSP
jgi:hypothetical protein